MFRYFHMYPYCSRDNLDISDIDETNNAVNSIIGSNDDNVLYQDQLLNQDPFLNQDLDATLSSYIDKLINEQSFSDFLNFPVDDELLQDNYDDNNYEGLPGIFEFNKLDGLSAEGAVENFDDGQPSTSAGIKRSSIECELPQTEPSHKIIKQDINEENTLGDSNITAAEPIITAPLIKSAEQLVQNQSINQQKYTPDTTKQRVMKKEITLRSYHRNDLYYTEFNASIYKDAIRRINIDNDGLFRKTILKELDSTLREKGLTKLFADFFDTYSNVRKYISDIIFPFLSDIIPNADVLITPGMSISDMKFSCMSNKIFFEKLTKKCEKIIGDIRAAPDDSLLHVFQSYINFSYEISENMKNKKFRLFPKRIKFIPALKILIIDTLFGLTRSIIREIDKFDQNDIVRGLFSDIHGVFISKSLIRDINSSFDSSSRNKFINNDFNDNLKLLNNLFEKLSSLVRKRCVFHEGGVFFLSEHTVEQLSRYLLSDIYGIPSRFHKELKLSELNSIAEQNNSDDYYKTEQISTVSGIVNTEQLEKRFSVGSYHRNNLRSKVFIESIYEDAIKKIDVDTKGSFENSVIEELANNIISKGFIKSSINLSLTYSNVRKYILDKISPHINDIITAADILVSVGMSISDMKSSCISNKIFFEKMNKNCEEITEIIRDIPEGTFSNMIQSNVRFGSDGHLNIVHKRSKFSSKIKELIIETIFNLSNSIIHEISKFKQSEIVKGLFSYTHGMFISKSLIRNINSFYYYNRLPSSNFDDHWDLLNSFFEKVLNMVKKSCILFEGRLFLPDMHTAKILSKYFLSDMYGIPSIFHKKIELSDDPVSTYNIKSPGDDTIDSYTKVESNLPEESKFIPKINPNWNQMLITSLNIYELALSMIKLDKEEFENHFINKMKQSSLVKKHFNAKESIAIDLSITYARIKGYILESFYPLLKESEEEIKNTIKIHDGITLSGLEHAYVSNEKFFTKLREFRGKLIKRIKDSSDSTLSDLIQYLIHLKPKTGAHKKILMKKKRRVTFSKSIAQLLIKNISSVPEKVVNAIKMLPPSKLVEEHFSLFYNLYIDNVSLLKVKSAFDFTREKVMNDPILVSLVDKISLDMVSKFGNRKNSRVSISTYKIINSNIVTDKLSTYNYIRKLVREEVILLKNNISESIMVMYGDKIKTADQKIKNEILDKLESDLIETSIKLYRGLCVKTYKSKIATSQKCSL